MQANWPVKKLGEVLLLIQNGVNPKQGDSGQYPISRIETVQNSSFDPNRVKFADLAEGEFEKYKYEFGDIAFSHINSYEKIGKVALFDGQIKNLVHGVNLLRFKSNPEICLPEYLFFILQTKQFRDEIDPFINKAVNQASINQTSLKNRLILIPPVLVQKKIVERLDAIRKAQEFCDQQIQKTEELFESVVGEFENKQIGVVSRLEDLLIEPLQNGVNFSKTQMGNGTLLVNVKDVYIENEIEEGKLERISITEKETRNYSLQDGDILFVRSSVKRDGVGFTAIFKPVSNEPIVYSGFIIKARVNTRKILPQYLLYVTRSKHLRKRIIESSGTGTITNINQGSINRLQILVPDLKTQRKIVEKLEVVQNYKKLLQKEKTLLKELFDSVLDKSMKGELDN